MYVYDYNAILTTVMKIRSDREVIRFFTYLTEDLKIHGIDPCFNFMNNDASTALKITMTSVNIHYHSVTPNNQRSKTVERDIQTFKNHFIAGMCSVEKDFHLQMWYRLL